MKAYAWLVLGLLVFITIICYYDRQRRSENYVKCGDKNVLLRPSSSLPCQPKLAPEETFLTYEDQVGMKSDLLDIDLSIIPNDEVHFYNHIAGLPYNMPPVARV